MLKKVSIRLRFTILTIILLTICCIGLTVVLNLSANKMADILAIPLTPAQYSTDEQTEIPKSTFKPSIISKTAQQDFRLESIFYMLLMITVGGGLTYYVSGKALEPLNRLSCQMKNRTAANLSHYIDLPQTKDEIEDLTRSFNEMTHKLNDTFLMQKRFSQSAAHELRTPLTVLKTKIDVFKKKNIHTQDEYESLIEVVSTYTDRLSSLVKNLLDMTNMEDLMFTQSISLKSLLQDVIADLGMPASDKNITIVHNGECPTILGNYNLLHRAFYNLVENGIRYNHEHGRVEINVLCSKKTVVIEICDTGIGIPHDIKEYVFQPFFRVDKSRSHQMGGTGLGLSIVKSIIEKHNGEISIMDNIPTGTIFRISLPK